MNKITLFVFACLSSQQTILSSAQDRFQANHPVPQEIQTALDQLEQNKTTLRILAHNALQNYRNSFTEFLAADFQQSHQLTKYPTKELLRTFRDLCDKKVSYTKLKELTEPEHRIKTEDNMIAARMIFAYLNYQSIHNLLRQTIEQSAEYPTYHINPKTLALQQKEKEQEKMYQEFVKAVSSNTAR